MARASFTLQMLPIPSGATSGRAQTLSRNGLVVGGICQTPSGSRTYRWSAADGITLVPVLDDSIANAYTNAIDYAGLTIVGVNVDNTNSWRAFRWRGQSYDLGSVPQGLAGDKTATGVSGDGKTIVGGAPTSISNRAFRWTLATGMVALPVLPGDYDSLAYGISANGLVIHGVSRIDGTKQHAVYWDAQNAIHKLAVHATDGWSEADCATLDGSIIFGASGPDNLHAGLCKWTGSTLTYLGSVPNEPYMNAFRVSDDGNVVLASAGGFPYFWTPQSGFVNGRSYLLNHGITFPSGYTFGSITGMSADGKTISGYLNGPSGERPFIGTIDLPPAPQSLTFSPSSVTGGASTYGKVTLTRAADGNTTILLSSANTSIATVPASIIIYKGKTNASFVVQSKSVAVTKHLAITAKLNLASTKGTLTVNP